MVVREVEAIHLAPVPSITRGLEKQTVFGLFGPLKMLNLPSTKTISLTRGGQQSCRQGGKQPAGTRGPGSQSEITGRCVRIQEEMGVRTMPLFIPGTPESPAPFPNFRDSRYNPNI